MKFSLSKRRILVILPSALALGLLAFLSYSILPILAPSPQPLSTRLLSRNSTLLYETAPQGVAHPVPLSEIAPSFLTTLLTSEDHRFYQHHGIDWLALGREARNLLTTGHTHSGASTIEQQLVKTLYFPNEKRTILEKLRELIAARFWSLRHTKDETLERYANTAYFGNGLIGVEAASQAYFHTSAKNLTTAESAILVGAIPSPARFDPYAHRLDSIARETSLLDRLVAAGELSVSDRDAALSLTTPVYAPRHAITAPHFVLYVLDTLEKRIPDIRSGGYVIRTTLDTDLQTTAETSIERRLAKLTDQHVSNASAVAVDPRTGDILTYVGSADYFNERDGQVDMARALRQPGSALKPFAYLAALMQGFTPASIIADLPVRFIDPQGEPYYPRNYGYRFNGPVPLREALGSSLNVPAVKVLDAIGLPAFAASLAHFGVSFSQPIDHYGLPVVLGGGEVSLLDAVRAYAGLARFGHTPELRSIIDVQDASGKTVYAPEVKTLSPVLSDETKVTQASSLMADILSDHTARSRSFGEVSRMDTGKRIAVKTGTTKDFRDNWSFGYTPDFVLGVWVGNADNTPMQGVTGVTGAVPIWRDIIDQRFAHSGDVAWPVVPGIVTKDVCVTSGLLMQSLCPKSRTEHFIAGTEPTKVDDWYVRCGSRTYLHLPAEYTAWQISANQARPAPGECGAVWEAKVEPLRIISPLDGEKFERDQRMDPGNEGLPFIAGGGSGHSYQWVLDGQSIASKDPIYVWQMVPGEHELNLVEGDRIIRFSVR